MSLKAVQGANGKIIDLKSSKKKRNTKYRESELRECQAKGLVRNAIGKVTDRNSK